MPQVDIHSYVPDRGAGRVSLVSAGPPRWIYRLTRIDGWVNHLVFSDYCSGTTGSVQGGAQAAGWTVQNYSDSIVFSANGALQFGYLDGFTLSHPSCSDRIRWAAGDSSGNVDGPLPVELLSFSARPENGRIELGWRTASETHNDHFAIERDGAVLANVRTLGNDASGHTYRWADNNVTMGTVYTYKLVAVDEAGARQELATKTVTMSPNSAAEVTEYALHQNYPNPFNPTTNITFDVLESGYVTLKVYNLMGQEVATLVNGSVTRGRHTVNLNAINLPSGVYLCRMTASSYTSQIKMLLMK